MKLLLFFFIKFICIYENNVVPLQSNLTHALGLYHLKVGDFWYNKGVKSALFLAFRISQILHCSKTLQHIDVLGVCIPVSSYY